MTEHEFRAIRAQNPEAYFTLQIVGRAYSGQPFIWLDYWSIRPDYTTSEVINALTRLINEGRRARLVRQSHIPNCPFIIMGDTEKA